MGFIDFAKKQWKKHQINEEKKSLERQRLNRLARDAETVGYAQERGKQMARDENARYRRQKKTSISDISRTTWGLIDDPKKRRKKRKR